MVSKGPGRVERALRALIEEGQSKLLKLRERNPRYPDHDYSVTGWDILRAAYPDVDRAVPWTKAQRVSAFRAMHRIIAGQEHWTVERQPRRQAKVYGVDQVLPLQFRWQPPPEPPKTKPKPVRVNEPVWAYYLGNKGKYVWRQATIVSRGGASPDRVTVEYDGRKWQCDEHRDGYISCRAFFSDWKERRSAPSFCHASAKAEIEQDHRDYRRRQAQFFGFSGDGASAEALTMLDLRPPFTRADVQKAFRAKSLKAHPDQGGDPAFMRALVMARDAALADADG